MSDAYAFIDGAYFRQVTSDLVQKMFNVPAEIDYSALHRSLRNFNSGHVRRVFYYDCLDDIRKNGESESDFDARVQSQRDAFDLIQSTEGFHVRLGSLSGRGNKKRQKKVDVLLAVEALDHAFRKNMEQVCLITGDLDFCPLVDSLVELGTYVRVLYEPKSASRELCAAADAAHPIQIVNVHEWSAMTFRQKHPIPHAESNSTTPPGAVLKTGTAKKRTVRLSYQSGMHYIHAPIWDYGAALTVEFRDFSVLERYFEMMYSPIEWHEAVAK